MSPGKMRESLRCTYCGRVAYLYWYEHIRKLDWTMLLLFIKASQHAATTRRTNALTHRTETCSYSQSYIMMMMLLLPPLGPIIILTTWKYCGEMKSMEQKVGQRRPTQHDRPDQRPHTHATSSMNQTWRYCGRVSVPWFMRSSTD